MGGEAETAGGKGKHDRHEAASDSAGPGAEGCVLHGQFGWGEIVVTGLVTFVMLGIEEIGVEIEDPFGVDDNDLPLEAFCATIERDLRGVGEA